MLTCIDAPIAARVVVYPLYCELTLCTGVLRDGAPNLTVPASAAAMSHLYTEVRACTVYICEYYWTRAVREA